MVHIFIEGELLDQYGDESVSIVSSVMDVSDVSKVTGDYSNIFTIPASKNNNRLFKHWYNASIDGGFDARTKVKGHIEIGGVPFKTGKWLLHDVSIKNGRVENYKINFNGDTANIKSTVGKDKLNTLDLSHLNHDYDAATVKTGFTSVDGAVAAYP